MMHHKRPRGGGPRNIVALPVAVRSGDDFGAAAATMARPSALRTQTHAAAAGGPRAGATSRTGEGRTRVPAQR